MNIPAQPPTEPTVGEPAPQGLPESNEPAQPVPKPPSRRAFVQAPALAFFGFDSILLLASGRPIVSALLFAAASAVLVGWFLDRRYKRVVQEWEQARLDQLANPQPVHPETGRHTRKRSDKERPPVGSWSNPSRSQKFWSRWDKAIPYSRRRHRR